MRAGVMASGSSNVFAVYGYPPGSSTTVLGMENGLPGDGLDIRLNDGLVDWESRTETDEPGTFELEVGCPPLTAC